MCIEQMPPTSVSFVVEAMTSWGADKAACHMYACRVVMRVLEHCTEPQVRTLLSQILGAAPRLAQDRYGNYVLQHVLEHGRPDAKRSILINILGAHESAVELAKHKYAHNVVEKCVILASDLEQSQRLPPPPGLESEGQVMMREALLWESTVQGQPMAVENLASDRFGSQVVMCLLENCRGPTQELLLSQLRSCAPRLNGLAYTEPVLAFLQA
jgi:pumilio RNA-binding family